MVYYCDSNFEPDCSIGYLAKRIHQLGLGALEPIFAEEGVTGPQWSALVAIHFGRGRTSAALAREMSHDKGAMTRLIDTIEQKGWIERTRDTNDRRIINLALTPEGQAVAMRTRDRVIAAWNAWLADWDHDEIERTVATLQKLRDQMLNVVDQTQSVDRGD
ncbi:MarR family winged helix-turn-helix transcriptional regulator [Sphingomonas aracearum]|uniref:MarR family winged helix-turn-helix transcriptional regulator n=1 Tax=Sphingomonas aracearum TaxID=2283317 RepID=UPI001EF0B733|nr:MarR family transcriptional regulator [Sphingomonas aracearum]